MQRVQRPSDHQPRRLGRSGPAPAPAGSGSLLAGVSAASAAAAGSDSGSAASACGSAAGSAGASAAGSTSGLGRSFRSRLGRRLGREFRGSPRPPPVAGGSAPWRSRPRRRRLPAGNAAASSCGCVDCLGLGIAPGQSAASGCVSGAAADLLLGRRRGLGAFGGGVLCSRSGLGVRPPAPEAASPSSASGRSVPSAPAPPAPAPAPLAGGPVVAARLGCRLDLGVLALSSSSASSTASASVASSMSAISEGSTETTGRVASTTRVAAS